MKKPPNVPLHVAAGLVALQPVPLADLCCALERAVEDLKRTKREENIVREVEVDAMLTIAMTIGKKTDQLPPDTPDDAPFEAILDTLLAWSSGIYGKEVANAPQG